MSEESRNAGTESDDTEDLTSLLISLLAACRLPNTSIATPILDASENDRGECYSAAKDDLHGDTPLHLASQNDRLDTVEDLLQNNTDDNTQHAGILYSRETSLHLAAEMGYVDIVKAIIDHACDVNAIDTNGNTPLHLASQHGHLDIVEDLLRNSAFVNICNASRKTPLHLAAEMGYLDIVKALIYHHCDVNAVDRNGNTALHHAASNGHAYVVNALLNQTVEENVSTRSQLSVNQVPAAELAPSQHAIGRTIDLLLQTLIQLPEQDDNVEIVNLQSSLSSTVNSECCGEAAINAEVIENMVFNGTNVNACNKAKMTPLHLASKNGHTSIVEILLDNHATVDVMKQTKETPLYLAAKNGHAAVSDLLMHRGICDFVVIPSTCKLMSPLHIAIKESHTEVVDVILKHSRRIYEKLTNGDKTLQENLKRGVMPVELLKPDGRRVSIEIAWTEEITNLETMIVPGVVAPLALAAFSGDSKMVQHLLRSIDLRMYSEEDIAINFRSILDRIQPKYLTYEDPDGARKCRANVREVAQFLINSGNLNVNHQDDELNSFLHSVIMHNYEYPSKGCLGNFPNWQQLMNEIITDLLELILEKGADFNMKNNSGQTPLIIASERGFCNVIQILFDWEDKLGTELDLDARDRYGATALIISAYERNISVMQMLLSRKVSVNLSDHYGFTALHAAVYQLNTNWFDLHFFCKDLLKPKFDTDDDHIEISSKDKPARDIGLQMMEEFKLDDRLRELREYGEETYRIIGEMVKLLLANDEINVNAIDFEGNTPLDLAVNSSRRVTSATLEALKNRGAIRKSVEPIDEAPFDFPTVDERGRNPLHRLVISLLSDDEIQYNARDYESQDTKRLRLMVDAILLSPENFRHLATATDDRGRTPIHYAAMPPFNRRNSIPISLALKLCSDVNASDIYGKTPLHYAEENYVSLSQNGANEDIRDKCGRTPKELRQLRETVNVNESTAKMSRTICTSSEYHTVPDATHVTELTKRKLLETVRITSQSPRPKESSEEAIWKIWTQNEFTRLNRRLSQLKPSVQHFMDRLAVGIKEKDERFECQPILVGSANEEAKTFDSADFDFTLKLTRFGQHCDAFPHPLGPKGYFQLRRKPSVDAKRQRVEKFDCFFNSDQCLQTDEVNYRTQILVEGVLEDPHFWQNENLFEWDFRYELNSRRPASLCKTIQLRMINPIKDGESGFLYVDISVDIVACVDVEGWLSDDPLPFCICPSINTNSSMMVIDRPRFNPSKPGYGKFAFSETFARISFAPLESQTIKESSPLIRAAYIVCKLILNSQSKTSYQLKTCVLFCMEALNARNVSEARNENEITPKHLAFLVERIMFCYVEFSRHRVFPCYFMNSFKQQAATANHHGKMSKINEEEKVEVSFAYSTVDEIYLNLCPDDTTIGLISKESPSPNRDPFWEQFDRKEFIKMLSSRSSS